jgi:UDP-glucose 4-epimerase
MPHIYGPGRPAGQRGNVIQEMLEAAQTGKTFTMSAGGDQTKEPVYVEDIVTGTVAVLSVPADRLVGRAYNLGTGEVFTWRQIAAAVQDIYPKADLQLGDGPITVRPRVLEQKLGPLDWSRAHTAFDYTPRYKLREGLAHFDAWLRSSRASASAPA